MGKRIKKIIAGIGIITGIAVMAVPFYYHFHGQKETDRLLEQFEQIQEVREDGTELPQETDEETALLAEADVIGIIEIEAIGIRYPVLEGAGTAQMRYAIGHITETAGLGEKGNCVLCGHNGSRNGTFFTKLNQLSVGDRVKLTDKAGAIHLYEVAETYIVGPYDNSVKEQTDGEVLTLLTCANRGTKRFICRCTPVREEGETNE